MSRAPEHRVAAAVRALPRVHDVDRATARRRRSHDPQAREAAVRERHLRPIRRPSGVRADRQIAGARHRTCDHGSKNRNHSDSNRGPTRPTTCPQHHATTIEHKTAGTPITNGELRLRHPRCGSSPSRCPVPRADHSHIARACQLRDRLRSRRQAHFGPAPPHAIVRRSRCVHAPRATPMTTPATQPTSPTAARKLTNQGSQ